MNYTVLATELDTDPLGRGYSGMSDAEAATDLNTAYRTATATHLSGAQVYEQVDITEFVALDATQQEEVWNIVHLGDSIDVQPGSKARDRFVTIFGGGSDTITALAATLQTSVSRAQELGLGAVTAGDVQTARVEY